MLTLINKSRNKAGDSNNRMPSFGGEPPLKRPMQRPLANVPPQPPKRRPAEYRPVEEPVQAPRPAVYHTHYNTSSEEGISKEYEQPDLLQRTIEGEAVKSKAAAASPVRPAKTQITGNAFRMAKGEDLRRAFIMSEVLGAPRSKRPLRKL
ncbi:hypothetical protein [Paenibacillus montanisoli]|uniref:Uncharacterized protein n=1 Tax=Paenibacillus montanisoli TaxID=2081970 RepID=A0A328U238_9BACL|nr:hypothetical protein [Paenibacillus montanisoli]RAP76709.1 hypothetical protein DL346_15280 [Paenibacillus montanisoli]